MLLQSGQRKKSTPSIPLRIFYLAFSIFLSLSYLGCKFKNQNQNHCKINTLYDLLISQVQLIDDILSHIN